GLHGGGLRPDQLGRGGPDRDRVADRRLPRGALRTPAVAERAARRHRRRGTHRALPAVDRVTYAELRRTTRRWDPRWLIACIAHRPRLRCPRSSLSGRRVG